MRQDRWIGPYMRMYSGRFALYLILGVLTLLAASMLMFTSGFLISKSATQPYNILLVYVPIVGVRAFGIGRAVIHYVERLVGHDTVLRILSKMRVRLYKILEPQALFIRSRFRTGDILGALADDIEQLQNVYIRTVFPSLIALILYAAAVIGIGMFDVTFALLIALYIFILVAVLPYISLKLTQKMNIDIKRERNGLYQKLTDAVMGIGDWVISGRTGDFLSKYEQDEVKVMTIDRQLRAWSRWRSLIGQLVMGLAVVSMIYWSAGQVATGDLNPVMIAAFVLVVFPLTDAFLPVSEAVQRIPEYRESLNRLNRISGEDHADEEMHVPADVANVDIAAASRKAHFQLQQVSYAYGANDANSVDDVSLDVPQGKRVAIIGRSGAGKSTLLKLIMGAIEPTQGTVTINGIPSSHFGDDMPKIISVLNQSPHLFDTTVSNNIMLGRPDASNEDIFKAAEQAQIGELIASLPNGLDTPMRETGQRFSGGERQRVALARVLLQDTPVLILDEPTVGLDPRTERELLSTIFHTTLGKTLIWVTHHLVGAEWMDEIIFMEHGKIIMRGTHAELIEAEPRYRNLYKLDRPSE
ncbi:ATP-binding cassette, subfamily C, CydC [Fontibacillus panacisegetis]|uniref:ATP-binding cassette, subfamily C, CydC n=1 Tax=Fontibacillus panacisegetis TaxID=670482 RepID=A0A1G7M8W9_9BACL|nr:thiol reductant ABC exporter subunit CydC [Fontibacillus panacisegetis]SDF58175.1 ATP-binding cassette, subfamily C, CydC [Fontibacillus panacisegetis]